VWDDLEPGHWYKVPDSRLRDHRFQPTPPGSFSGITAWSSGAFDTARDYYIIWGGGHGDYSGNEIYAFDVNTLEWKIITEPADDVGGTPESGVYPDGTPRSRHTYDYIEYIPTLDKFCSFGGSSLYPSGPAGTDRVDCIDFDDATTTPPRGWELVTTQPFSGGGRQTTFDPVTGHVWRIDNSDLYEWDPQTDTWSHRSNDGESRDRSVALHVPSRRMVSTGKSATYYTDVSGSGSLERFEMTTTGPKSVENGFRPGFEYDIATNQLVGWSSGTSVYTLDVETGEWRTCPPASTNSVSPTSPNDLGTFGRFRYIPSKNAYIVMNRVDDSVYLYRLSQLCADGFSDETPPTVPSNVSAGPAGETAVQLTWNASTDDESGVARYNIYRDGEVVDDTTETSYDDTGLAESTTYEYRVSAVNFVNLESAPSAAVQVTTATDVTPPTVVSVTAAGDPNRVVVAFSEPLENASATDASNYSIDGGVTISQVSLGADLVTVTLVTSTLASSTQYTLNVEGIRDRASVPNTIVPDAIQFTYSPVVTIQVRIENGLDDVEQEPDGQLWADSPDLEMGFEGGEPQTVGLRFNPVPVPQGATIVGAHIQFKVASADSDASELIIEGEDSDDAGVLSTLITRPRTSASVGWSPDPWPTVDAEGPLQRTVNIAPVIQEIVSRPGWSAGNALVIIIDGTGTRNAHSSEGDSAGAPLLEIEYTNELPTDPPDPPEGLIAR